ncbi:MAG: hypothetical protein OEY61_12075 [Gammaproteobacteria bacterium]|nr:hypothetical protein [Gammaproteobacteria bacterium]
MTEFTTTEADAAWASINTPLTVETLKYFCRDIERLFRINPMLEFYNWKAHDPQHYFFSGRNISQENPFEFEFELTVTELPNGFKIDYDRGIKSSTEFIIEPAEQGSKLTITDRYEAMPEDERKQHIDKVDKSLVTWANYLQRFLITWQRWSGFGLWRWYMSHIWQPMKPAGRRITYMLLWITMVEIALIVLGVGIYFAEYA